MWMTRWAASAAVSCATMASWEAYRDEAAAEAPAVTPGRVVGNLAVGNEVGKVGPGLAGLGEGEPKGTGVWGGRGGNLIM